MPSTLLLAALMGLLHPGLFDLRCTYPQRHHRAVNTSCHMCAGPFLGCSMGNEHPILRFDYVLPSNMQCLNLIGVEINSSKSSADRHDAPQSLIVSLLLALRVWYPVFESLADVGCSAQTSKIASNSQHEVQLDGLFQSCSGPVFLASRVSRVRSCCFVESLPRA